VEICDIGRVRWTCWRGEGMWTLGRCERGGRGIVTALCRVFGGNDCERAKDDEGEVQITTIR
jgi:hypothetical protein